MKKFFKKIGLLLTVGIATVVFNSCCESHISLNKTTLGLAVGESETLTATAVTSTCATAQITWSSNNAVATVDSIGKVTALSTGTAVITATKRLPVQLLLV